VIVFRYLCRELLLTTAAVTAVLLLVITSGRFVKYLAEAATGRWDPDVLFAIIGYRLPEFLELIVPLAFFLAILLVLGRLYAESEMTVLNACGFSQTRLVCYTLAVALLIVFVTSWLSLVVKPSGTARSEALLNAQRERGELEGISAGRFYRLQGGRGVTYAESLGSEGQLEQVFLADITSDEERGDRVVLVLAEDGRSVRGEAVRDRFLVLRNGQRIEGRPGEADFQVTDFVEYGQRLASARSAHELSPATAPTRALLGLTDPESQAELHWRFAVPILVLVVTLIAVPLSKTSARQGRYVKTFPAIMLYIIYLVMLSGARGRLEDGEIAVYPGLWAIHALFFGIGIVLLSWDTVNRRLRARRYRAEEVPA